MITRRTALFGLGGAALLACGGGLAWWKLGYRLAPDDAPIGLDTKELAIVRAIVAALCPADGELPSGLALGVHQRIDEEVWSAPAAVRDDLKSALQLIEVLPLLKGYGGRFSRLDPLDAERCYATLLATGARPVQHALGGLKQMCMLFYYASDATWPAIAFDGPWVKTPRPPDSSLRYAALLAAARATS